MGMTFVGRVLLARDLVPRRAQRGKSNVAPDVGMYAGEVDAIRDREGLRVDGCTSDDEDLVVPGGGSVFEMGGRLQRDWVHRVPRTARAVGPRLNLTFRVVRVGPTFRPCSDS